jgi:hypothetical protein
MKKLLLTSVAALFLATGTASAASIEVPKQYRGLWCYSNGKNNIARYYRCREATGEDYEYIGRSRMKIDEETSCPIIAVKPTAKGHRLTWRCLSSTATLPDGTEVNVGPIIKSGNVDVWLVHGRLHEKWIEQ